MSIPTISTTAFSTTQLTQQLHTGMDGDSDGSVSLEEFIDAKDAADIAGQAPASTEATSAEDFWSMLDDDGNGGLSIEELSELAARIEEGMAGSTAEGAAPAGAPAGGPPAGGAPPAGGPPAGGAAGGSQATSGTEEESGTSVVYDEADTNKDGEVSEAERQAYELEQLMASSDEEDGASSSSELTRAVGAYQQVAGLWG